MFLQWFSKGDTLDWLLPAIVWCFAFSKNRLKTCINAFNRKTTMMNRAQKWFGVMCPNPSVDLWNPPILPPMWTTMKTVHINTGSCSGSCREHDLYGVLKQEGLVFSHRRVQIIEEKGQKEHTMAVSVLHMVSIVAMLPCCLPLLEHPYHLRSQ